MVTYLSLLAPATALAQSNDRFIDEMTIKRYDEKLARNPDDDEAIGNRGALHLRVGNYDLALRDFARADRLRPGNSNLAVYRGLALWKPGRIDEAHAEFAAALRIEPDNALAIYCRGVVHRETGQVERGEADIASALRLDPDVATGYQRIFRRN